MIFLWEGQFMIPPSERKKNSFTKSLKPSFGAEMKKYEELYAMFTNDGYTKELCEEYAEAFINNAKKPAADDIIQVASLYDKIYDNKSAAFYLEMLAEKKTQRRRQVQLLHRNAQSSEQARQMA